MSEHVEIYEGPAEDGMPIDPPEYVLRRLLDRAWDDTPQDRLLQELNLKYFSVFNESTGQWEVWKSTPAGNLCSTEKVLNVRYPGDDSAPIDSRVVVLLRKYDNAEDLDVIAERQAYKELRALQPEKTAAEVDEIGLRAGEEMLRILSDSRTIGRVFRPARGIIVPDKLQLGGV